jgi:hypothetical protein
MKQVGYGIELSGFKKVQELKKFREIESIPKQGCGFPAHLGEPKKTFDVGDWAQSLQTLVI